MLTGKTIKEQEQIEEFVQGYGRYRRVMFPLSSAKRLHRPGPMICGLFRLANIAEYPEKKEFYRFKSWFLMRVGKTDGWDGQYIVKKCWGCGGEGCERCDESGNYAEYYIFLRRFLLSGIVYHIPVERVYMSHFPLFDYPKPKNDFSGLLPKAKGIPSYLGTISLMVLMIFYAPKSVKKWFRWKFLDRIQLPFFFTHFPPYFFISYGIKMWVRGKMFNMRLNAWDFHRSVYCNVHNDWCRQA